MQRTTLVLRFPISYSIVSLAATSAAARAIQSTQVGRETAIADFEQAERNEANEMQTRRSADAQATA